MLGFAPSAGKRLRMSIQLPSDVETKVKQQVAGGKFADEDDVVREAMPFLDERERQTEMLRVRIRVGLDELDRGEGDEWTQELMERLNREADEMYRRGELPDPDVCP
jgi:putative addiction module CopG family antidote